MTRISAGKGLKKNPKQTQHPAQSVTMWSPQVIPAPVTFPLDTGANVGHVAGHEQPLYYHHSGGTENLKATATDAYNKVTLN